MISNPGFESSLNGWANWGNSVAVTGQAVAGSFALRVGTADGGIGQTVISRVTAGARYRYTGSALVSAAGEVVYLGVKFTGAAGTVLELQTQVRTTAYSRFTIDFTLPQGATDGYVYVWKNAGPGFAYVDEVSLSALP